MSAGVVAAVVLAASGVSWWLASRGSPAVAQTNYRLVAASLGTVRQSVSTTGTIEPAEQDEVNFAASGRVTSVRVAEGDRVTKGQVLATVDSASLAAALAEADATLATDQARVSSDESNGADATQLQADEAAVTAAQGQVGSAQAAMAAATLRAPIDGLVASVNLAVGDQVSGSSSGSAGGSGAGGAGGSGGGGGSGSNGAGNGGSGSTGSGAGNSGSSSAQFLVIGTMSWEIDATVDDTQVGLLKKGNQAQLTTDGGTTVFGTISSIGLIASNSSGSAAYPVTVAVTGSPSGLHAGATGTVALIYKQLTNVLTVPTLAVHAGNGSSVVYEISGGRQVAHPVTTGLASGGVTQILGGLAEGDQVVVTIPVARTGTTGNGARGRSGTGGGGFFGGTGGGGFVPGGGGGFFGGSVNGKPIVQQGTGK
jgi:multidrug efflux pump subunit AcrA (membrane-fusion protein)